MGVQSVVCDVQWRAGDRWEVFARAASDTSVEVLLPRELRDAAVAPERVVDGQGRPIAAVLAPGGGAVEISGPAGGPLLDAGTHSIWIEYVAPRHYRLLTEGTGDARVGRASHDCAEPKTAAANGDIQFDPSDLDLLHRPAAGTTAGEFALGLSAARLATHPGFDQLISLPMVRDMEVLEH